MLDLVQIYLFTPSGRVILKKNQVAQIFQKSSYRKTYLAIIMLVSDSAEMRNYISISAELATFNHYVCAQFPAQ